MHFDDFGVLKLRLEVTALVTYFHAVQVHAVSHDSRLATGPKWISIGSSGGMAPHTPEN